MAGAGGVDHNQLIELAGKHFGQMEGPNYDVIPEYIKHCRYTGSEIRVRDDSIPLAHIAIAVEGNIQKKLISRIYILTCEHLIKVLDGLKQTTFLLWLQIPLWEHGIVAKEEV